MDNQMMGGYEYLVDIVMCIDATGSMYRFLDNVKSRALSIHQQFTEAMEEKAGEVAQLRVKVIAFRDYGCDSEPMVESKFFVLPEENDAFQSFVNSIEAKGGGDGPENALEALALALKSDWVVPDGQGNQKARHVVFMFSDAPALPLDARAGCASYPAGMPKDLAELGEWWEGVSQEFSGTYSVRASRFLAFVPEATPWPEIQAWNRYWPMFDAEVGGGLDNIDIVEALKILAGTI